MNDEFELRRPAALQTAPDFFHLFGAIISFAACARRDRPAAPA
jgi:hypothetical protein